MEQNDEQLIKEYFAGNTKAIEMLFSRHKKLVFNYAFRVLANRADAEDVTADVFFALFTKKYTFQPDVKFTSWLYVVIRNACFDRLRKRKRFVSSWFQKKDQGDFAEWTIPDDNAVTDRPAQIKEMSGQVKQAIEQLPQQQKEAIILREYEQLSYQEISEVLDCTVENVKVLIFRAREQLRKGLASFMQGGL
ncbi:MAG: hypothetical protein A2787_08865 [Omnitrophica WOR_2 bacterium RIFCSPHIGHO2_01_FULL_48_9]|nr:MAG: hypothetical protein A3D10_07375 [Omnitrophica WOR_2 bacterium RIFCSPHIGHO2_02_FULL_48_11]OGX30264.1 MAG: hypothetical protein A2787_08865 [Omnitrophica WOR_2 bacterium RIFCSPHIGHO2_01_FULL_48_9]